MTGPFHGETVIRFVVASAGIVASPRSRAGRGWAERRRQEEEVPTKPDPRDPDSGPRRGEGVLRALCVGVALQPSLSARGTSDP